MSGLSAARLGALLLVAASACGAAVAGAFVQRQGEGAVYVTGYVTSGDKSFDGDGKLRSRGRFTKRELQGFVEYGLTDRITAFASVPLQKITIRNPSAGRDGFGRSEVGVRAKLFEADGWIGSVQASGLIGGATRNEGLAAIGERDGGVDVRGLVARSFELMGKPAFVDLQAGYRTRTGDPSDEVRIDATCGVRITPELLVMAQSFNQDSVKRWDGAAPLRQRIHKLQGVVIYDLTDRLSVFGAAFFMPYGRDAIDERGGTVGVGYRF